MTAHAPQRPSALDAAVIDWLMKSEEPAIRRLARRDLLDERVSDDDDRILDGPIVRALLGGQQPDGGFGVHAYGKWSGAHWRLISLVELGIPAGEPRALAAAGTVLDWLTGPSHRRNVPVIRGLARRCGSQEGNALAVACRLGLYADERVHALATSLVEWQWPDGGWNCDRRPQAHRSSFHETLPPIWGLHEYAAATGQAPAREAARRGAELLLEHGLFRTISTGKPIRDEWLTPHWPPYWHYDVLQGLVVIARLGLGEDPRTADAKNAIERRRQPDGRWPASARWWKPPGGSRAAEAVDWRADASGDRMVTLRALTVLRAGRTSNVPPRSRRKRRVGEPSDSV
jgi:hypothetical protein